MSTRQVPGAIAIFLCTALVSCQYNLQSGYPPQFATSRSLYGYNGGGLGRSPYETNLPNSYGYGRPNLGVEHNTALIHRPYQPQNPYASFSPYYNGYGNPQHSMIYPQISSRYGPLGATNPHGQINPLGLGPTPYGSNPQLECAACTSSPYYGVGTDPFGIGGGRGGSAININGYPLYPRNQLGVPGMGMGMGMGYDNFGRYPMSISGFGNGNGIYTGPTVARLPFRAR